MNLLTETMSGLGGVLLPLATGLLLEELTLGGLVKLVMSPWFRTGLRGSHGEEAGLSRRKRVGKNKKEGEGR